MFFNILGAIVSGVASIIAIIFVASMDAVSSFDSCNPSQTGDECVCSESRERLDRTCNILFIIVIAITIIIILIKYELMSKFATHFWCIFVLFCDFRFCVSKFYEK